MQQRATPAMKAQHISMKWKTLKKTTTWN